MRNGEEIKALANKADRSLRAAWRLFKDGDYDFAISRAYYAMFYCTEALLLSKNLRFSKHSAVISAFGREFVKPGIFPSEFHRYLLDAFRERQRGDYEVILHHTKEDCETILLKAEKFLKKIKKYLKL